VVTYFDEKHVNGRFMVKFTFVQHLESENVPEMAVYCVLGIINSFSIPEIFKNGA
jgi:hypothetical protein